MRKFLAIVCGIALFCAIPACKTSEKNYRAAYERAIAGRDSETADLPSGSSYTRIHKELATGEIAVGDRTLPTASQYVAITPDGGGINENIKRFCVVAGRFKQVFNARSMRERLVDSGYPGAFVVQTREPYYYVVAGAFSDASAAADLFDKLKADASLALTHPMPLVLIPSQLNRTR